MLNSLKTFAAALLIASGSTAAAQSARPLSLATGAGVDRAGAESEQSAGLRGRVHAYALGLALIAILVFVLVEVTDNDETTEPVSP